jgi:hypothetical protein
VPAARFHRFGDSIGDVHAGAVAAMSLTLATELILVNTINRETGRFLVAARNPAQSMSGFALRGDVAALLSIDVVQNGSI